MVQSKHQSIMLSIDFPEVKVFDPSVAKVLPFLTTPTLLRKFQFLYGISMKFFSVTVFIMFVISCSNGIVTFLKLPGWCTEEALMFVADFCPCLKSLSVAEELLYENRCIFTELKCKWKNLKELSLGGSYNLVKIIEQISIHCKNFYALTLFESLGRYAAMSIVSLLPNIKNLTLMNSEICRDDFVVILQGCKNLVLLDAKKCKGFNESDEEISKLASHISNFRCELVGIVGVVVFALIILFTVNV